MSNPYRDKLLSIGFINGPLPSKPKVREDRADDGQRRKQTTDELGNTVTQWAKGDRQDVNIKAPTVTVTTTTRKG
jgi:hypothetical protein